MNDSAFKCVSVYTKATEETRGTLGWRGENGQETICHGFFLKLFPGPASLSR